MKSVMMMNFSLLITVLPEISVSLKVIFAMDMKIYVYIILTYAHRERNVARMGFGASAELFREHQCVLIRIERLMTESLIA